MRRITDFIVEHCYIIFVVFLVLTAICGFLATKVNINKDIYTYMPEDSETSLGLTIMNDEFDYDKTSNYEMMLTDVPEDQKFEIKDYIQSIDGVKSVDYDETEEYNRENYTRYKINVDAPADSETAARVYNEIHDKYSEEYEWAESGQVSEFNGQVLQINIVILAVGFAMVILLIMSKSWIEPFLFLFAILLAVVANKGTNIIFPSVSHITDAISAVLQMALSMDYAIMLSTRYRQEKAADDHPDKKTAMRRAMRYSFGAICSSSVTTVVGLIVLVLMSFTIGRDMGLVLSKGVILSLVSIFTSLPALLLIFDKAIEKTAKKTINFKMDFMGRFANRIRHFAFPAFLLIFVAAFLLKGNTTIDYTASQNNKIKDVFNEANQMALVYDKKLDESVTRFCKELDAREDTTRVLCYGNTINEPEKYNEVIDKINELGSEKAEAEDYLIKALYYNYYKDVDAHTINLEDFVKFLQREVMYSERFSDEVDDETRNKINRLANFTDQIKVNVLRGRDEIAEILGVDAEKLDDVFVLYAAEQNPDVKLTAREFARFVENEVLMNSKYGTMVSESQKADLKKLAMFSDSAFTNTPKTAAELAKTFGISEDTVRKVIVYYNYSTPETPMISATVGELVNFALTDENVLNELGIKKEQADEILDGIDKIKESAKEHGIDVDAEEFNEQYSYGDVAEAAGKIETALDVVIDKLDNLDLSEYDEIDEETKTKIYETIERVNVRIGDLRQKISISEKLSEVERFYKLYQAESVADETNISAHELVDFLILHANDDELESAMSAEILAQLKLAQFVMQNQTTEYNYSGLAEAFGLDADKLKLVYALYDYRHVNTAPRVSLNDLISFIDEKILPNPEYAERLGENEKTQLAALATLMRSAAAGVQYNYESLYRAILPLAGDFDKNKLFLVYLYHGSLYDYDENWTLTLEAFVNYLADKILPDARFGTRIDEETKQKVLDGRTTINDAKDLLVGPIHYRALIETNLPAEGEKTFGLIRYVKEKMGPNNKIDYYVLGDSAMAYEMSQTFNDEMNFITIITMLAIFAVVVCTFKSLFVSFLLVLVIQCAVYIVMAYLSLTGSSIYFIALIIVQAILMGATIDYAILYTSYYMENRKHGKMNIKEALINTYNKSIEAILTSASILIIVTAIVGNFTSAIAGKICQSISLGTAFATIIILGLLPALLAALDKWIIKKK